MLDESNSVPVEVTSPPAIDPTTPLESVEGQDKRKTLALIFLLGGGMAMTVFAGLALWFNQGSPGYTFYLGLAAMINIFVVFSAIAGLLVKRTLAISREGITVNDRGNQPC